MEQLLIMVDATDFKRFRYEKPFSVILDNYLNATTCAPGRPVKIEQAGSRLFMTGIITSLHTTDGVTGFLRIERDPT